jgi:hypothetical protein
VQLPSRLRCCEQMVILRSSVWLLALLVLSLTHTTLQSKRSRSKLDQASPPFSITASHLVPIDLNWASSGPREVAIVDAFVTEEAPALHPSFKRYTKTAQVNSATSSNPLYRLVTSICPLRCLVPEPRRELDRLTLGY